MDELKKGANLSVPESLKNEALAACKKVLQAWEVAMPEVEPLVVDFGQGEFYRVGLIEYWIANEVEAGYCGKYLFLFDGQQCPFHGHRLKHETFFVVKGRIKMEVEGEERIMNEGDVLAMPPGEVHSFTGIGDALVLEVSTPCFLADNEFQEPGIAEWHKRSAGTEQ